MLNYETFRHLAMNDWRLSLPCTVFVAGHHNRSATLQYNTDAAASATATVKSMFCEEVCSIRISLGVSGVTDTLMLK